MPKLSVSVPDDLWDAVTGPIRSEDEKPSPSQLVQDALERMVRERRARTAALGAGAPRDEARLAAVVAGLLERARREYENGYNAAVELIETLGFSGLSAIIDNHGLIGALASGVLDAGDPGPVGDWLRRYEDELDTELSQGMEPFRAGAEQAVNDVWDALRADTWGTATRSSGVNEGPESAAVNE